VIDRGKNEYFFLHIVEQCQLGSFTSVIKLISVQYIAQNSQIIQYVQYIALIH